MIQISYNLYNNRLCFLKAYSIDFDLEASREKSSKLASHQHCICYFPAKIDNLYLIKPIFEKLTISCHQFQKKFDVKSAQKLIQSKLAKTELSEEALEGMNRSNLSNKPR